MKDLFLTRPRTQIIFNNLRIWRDLNQNGISEDGELKTLTETGIKEISLAETLIGADSIVKYITKRLSFFTFLIAAFFYTQFANADEVFPFTRITCIPELNYFDASVMEINSGADEETEFMSKKQRELKNRYYLIGDLIDDAHECHLKDSDVKIQIKYRPTKETGLCGGASDATLKLWVDDKLVVDLNHFNSCVGGRDNGIVHIGFKTFKSYKHSGLYFNTVGLDESNPDGECVIWVNSQLKNVESNYCNKSETDKTLPVKDSYIIRPLINKTK